jgi:hypothetical protein
MRGPFTAADDAALREMIARDMSAAAIGAAIGRSKCAIHRRARIIGVTWSEQYRLAGLKLGGTTMAAEKHAKRQAAIAQAVAMRNEGKSATEIADAMGQKRPTILKYLCEAGLGRPKGRKPRKVANPKPRFDVTLASMKAIAAAQAKAEAKWREISDAVRADVEAGMTLKDAAEKYQRGREYLRRWLVNDGWERPKPEPKPQRKAQHSNFIQRAGRPSAAKPADRSLYVDAATWLAPHYRPVVRADVVDRPYEAPKGEPREYIVGRLRVPACELLDMARGLGFPG